jgi:thiamine pyrophosphokinase
LHRTAIDPQNLILDNTSGGSVDTHHPKPRRAVIFAGGEFLTMPVPDPDAIVIAADSGYDHAIGLDYQVDLLVGDLDSISEAGLAHAEAEGVEIERHPVSKDATDLELALDAAVARGATGIDIRGGEGGRIDHLMGVGVGLSNTRWRDVDLVWHTEAATVQPLSDGGHLHLDAEIGSVVSLVVVSDCSGIVTSGLRWKLSGEELERGASRGLSNEIIERPSSVTLETGALLVVTETSGTT